jgi:signal recognition particle receptor subunit beta
MALVNHAKKEINAKIVYFGPAGSGKSTALRYIFSRIKPSLRGELKNIPADGDNLLFFDFSPFDGPMRDGYRVRLHVYTLTGRIANPATWKMTLKGADGLIIMVDSAPGRISDAQESISQLKDFLAAYGVGLHDTSAVLQLNSFTREQAVMDAEQLASLMDLAGLPCCTSCATSGEGVLEALTTLSRQVLDRVAEKDNRCDDNIEESVAGEIKDEVLLPISLACQGARVDGSTLRIPLDITCGGTNRRLVVTVSVDPG